MTKSPELPHEFMARLDSYDNELVVRDALVAGRYNERHSVLAKEWLKRREEKRDAETRVRSEAREEETISIANRALSVAAEANRIASEDLAAARESAESAREQARWAMWAAIIATVAAIVAMFKA